MSERRRGYRGHASVVFLLAGMLALLASLVAARADAYIYWSDGDAIGRANLDGSGVERGFIRLGGANAIGLTLHAGSILWSHPTACTSGGTSGIGRAGLDGTAVDELFIGAEVGCEGELAVGPGHLYWVGWEGSLEAPATIARATLEGGSVEQGLIVRHPADVGCDAADPDCHASIAGLAVGDHLYWAEGIYPSTDRLARANLAGTAVTTIATGIGDARALAIDGQHLYWATGNSIGRASLDGSGVEREFIDAKSPVAVAVDSEHLYWSECCRSGYGSIHRADIDGSNPDRDLIVKTGGLGLAVDGGGRAGGAVGKVKAKRTQRQRGARIQVKLHVRANTELTAKATGKVKPRYRLRPARERLDSGERETLTLKVKSASAREKIAAALADGRTATAKVTVALRGSGGDLQRERLSVRLRA